MESEGVIVLIKENEISDNHISFRVMEDGVVQSYFVSATRESPRVVRLFVQFPHYENSRKVDVGKGVLINLINRIVSEALDLVLEIR